jgi:hypothetical protein
MQFTAENMRVIRYRPNTEHELLGLSRCSVLIDNNVLIYKLQGSTTWAARKSIYSTKHHFSTLKEALVWLRLIA